MDARARAPSRWPIRGSPDPPATSAITTGWRAGTKPPTITGATRPVAGALVVADPREGSNGRPRFNNVFRVVRWQEPAGAVTAGASPSSAGTCVADPRLPDSDSRHHAKFRVEAWVEPAHTVTGSNRVGSGAPSVADPRLGCSPYVGTYGVLGWDEPSGTVTGASVVHNARSAVADPRPARDWSWTGRPGLLGVLAWSEASGAITASASVTSSNCPAAVADPRLPADNDRPDPPPLIIALDGTWHRPLTTLELAALQSLPMRMPDGGPLVLAGRSHAAWRERIGNAVPRDSAQAIGEAILLSLLGAGASSTTGFALTGGDVWVDRAAVIGRRGGSWVGQRCNSRSVSTGPQRTR